MSTVIASDTFTDTNGTALHSHTMTLGAGWSDDVGTWAINSNKVGATGSGQLTSLTTPPGSPANGVIICDMALASSPDAGLWFNMQDDNNGWLWAVGGGGSTHLYNVTSGTPTEKRNDGNANPSTTFTGMVYINGDTVTAWLGEEFQWKWIESSRPYKTQTKNGLRLWQADNGTTFDNWQFLSGFYKSVQYLSWSALAGPFREFNLFDQTFPIWTDTFSSDTSATYTKVDISGSTTFAIAAGVATFSGAGAGRCIIKATGTPALCPIVEAYINVTTSDAPDPEVGFYKDANNYVRVLASGGQVKVDYKANGSGSATTLTGTVAAPYKLGLSFNYPDAWVWADTGSGWAAIDRLTMTTTFDLHYLTRFATDWLPYCGFDRGAGETGTLDFFKVCYAGTYGIRDEKPLTYCNGKAYETGGEAFFLSTTANSDTLDGNSCCLLAINKTTGAARLATRFFFELDSAALDNGGTTADYRTQMYGGQVVISRDQTKLLFLVNSFGNLLDNEDSDAIHLYYAEMAFSSLNLSGGVHTIRAHRVSVTGWSNATYGFYDHSIYQEDDLTWHTAGTRYAILSGIVAGHTVTTSGASLTALTSGNVDSGGRNEAENWVYVGGVRNIVATGGVRFDTSLTSQTAISTTRNFSGGNSNINGTVFPALGVTWDSGTNTRYLMPKWDSSAFTLSAAWTMGSLYVFISDQIEEGTGLPIPVSASGGAAQHYYAQMRRLN